MPRLLSFKNNFSLTPLTISGLILSSSFFGLLFGLGLSSSDLVASTIGSIFLALLIALGILTSISALSIKQRLSPTIYLSTARPEQTITSGEAVTINCKLANLRLLPLTRLKLTFILDDPQLTTGRHELSGSSRQAVTLSQDIIFKHRGRWKVIAVRCSVQDAFGLWNLNITKKIAAIDINVEPPQRDTSNLDILSSIYTTGDTIPMGEKRAGDYYDLKTYSPSDGVSKIAWKIYARSGELITRQPEREVRPEGKAIIFCLAAAQDDQICSEAMAYMRLLQSLEIEIIFGCEGATQRKTAQSSRMAMELMISSARETNQIISQKIIDEFNYFLQSQTQLFAGEVANIILFIGESRLNSTQDAQCVANLIRKVNDNGLNPVVIVRDPNILEQFLNTKTAPLAWAKRWIISQAQSTKTIPAGLPELLATSAKNNWNVLTCP